MCSSGAGQCFGWNYTLIQGPFLLLTLLQNFTSYYAAALVIFDCSFFFFWLLKLVSQNLSIWLLADSCHVDHRVSLGKNISRTVSLFHIWLFTSFWLLFVDFQYFQIVVLKYFIHIIHIICESVSLIQITPSYHRVVFSISIYLEMFLQIQIIRL